MDGSKCSMKDSWEASKENIQPLQRGRRLAALNDSMSMSSADQESKVKKLFDDFNQHEDDSDDPLQPYAHLLSEYEQICPASGKFFSVLEQILHSCVNKFFSVQRYHNDPRLIRIFIKSLKNCKPEDRVSFYKTVLDSGIGNKVSATYLALAENLEFLERYNEAANVLTRGIEENIESSEFLKDALTQLQYRVAQRLSTKPEDAENNELKRTFGNAVPISDSDNEASHIRTDLRKATAVTRLTNIGSDTKKKFALFCDENDPSKSSGSSRITEPDAACPVRLNEAIKNDKENKLKAGKWNAPGTSMPDVGGTPAPKIEIYHDETAQAAPKGSTKAKKGVLSASKIEEPFIKPLPPVPKFPEETKAQRTFKAMYKDELRDGLSTEHLLRQRFLTKRNIEKVPQRLHLPSLDKQAVETRPDLSCSDCAEKKELIDELKLNLKKKEEVEEILKCKIAELEILKKKLQEQLLENDHLMLELKKEQSNSKFLELAQDEIEMLKAKNCNLEKKIQDNFEEYSRSLKEKDQDIEALKRSLISKESTVKGFEKPLIANNGFGLNKIPSRLSRYRSKEPSQSRGSTLENAKLAEPSHYIASPIAPGPTTLPFTLYESTLEGSKCAANDVSFPQEKNRKPVTALYPEKENDLPSALKAVPIAKSEPENPPETDNIPLGPSIPPWKMHARRSFGTTLCMAERTTKEDENSDDEIMMKMPGSGVDFNVSNLTRALAFYPKPLVNSTPERHARQEEKSIALDESRFGPPSILGNSDVLSAAGVPTTHNLSAIQENSKESRSTIASSSGSTNRGAVNFSSYSSNLTGQKSYSRHADDRY